ncbi:ribosome small subunit-dependent GTPase A [Streptomyces sp. NPDC004134]|uniref:ribosome small subunit-dependent GTPase A n=1 Tax=Streptomyces sp. NPDC004134 TaxID=3364691 RepID=UPI00368D9958
MTSHQNHAPQGTGHPLAAYGWTGEREADFAPFTAAGLVPGRVARVDLGRCDVVVPDPSGAGVHTVRAETAPVLDPDPVNCPCTGDWAAVDPGTPGPVALAALLPRSTALVRNSAGAASDGQALAVNVDAVLIASSLAAKPDLGRIERCLALAWESGAQPVVVLTKADVAHDRSHADDVQAAAPGVTVLVVSAVSGEGMDLLRACLPGTTALIGPSGAGKSTLTNALAGTEVMAVGETRERDEKGRHTTTARELIAVPGGVIIDTPGLRSVGLYGGDGLERTFADVEALAAECRYHDCAHDAEPQCAVKAAIEDGLLPARRLVSYNKLLRENERIAARSDARLAAERARQGKHRWKLMKAESGKPRP